MNLGTLSLLPPVRRWLTATLYAGLAFAAVAVVSIGGCLSLMAAFEVVQ